jgi:hypothetical protein
MNTKTKGIIALAAALPLVIVPLGIQAGAQATNAKVSASMLQYLVAEEKLAHDVYVTLGDEYGMRIFDNISRAESTHMSSVQTLLAKYGIKDPTVGDKVGQFDDPVLQKLYNDLVEQGMQSRQDAIEVGIAIEEMDIADLEKSLDAGQLPDVERVLERLLSGSERHLSAFERNLRR